jgi:hypothetical protein
MLPLGSRPLASCLLMATNIVAFELSASVGLETPLTRVVRVYVGSFGVGDALRDPPHDPSRKARTSNLRMATNYARCITRHPTFVAVTRTGSDRSAPVISADQARDVHSGTSRASGAGRRRPDDCYHFGAEDGATARSGHQSRSMRSRDGASTCGGQHGGQRRGVQRLPLGLSTPGITSLGRGRHAETISATPASLGRCLGLGHSPRDLSAQSGP